MTCRQTVTIAKGQGRRPALQRLPMSGESVLLPSCRQAVTEQRRHEMHTRAPVYNIPTTHTRQVWGLQGTGNSEMHREVVSFSIFTLTAIFNAV